MVEFDRRAFMIGAAGVLAGAAAGVAVPSLASAGVPPASATHHIFAVDDYGASPGGASDSAPAIRAAVAAAASWTGGGSTRTASVVFSSAVYRIDRISTASWYALEIDGVARIALYGSSTTLLVTTPYAGALSIARSSTIRVEGFTIDYAIVPFTQGTITAIDAVAGTVDLQLMSGYPTLADVALFPASNYGTLRNATTGLMKRGGQITFSYTHTGAVLPSGRWRLTIAPDHRPQMGAMALGDGFVTGFRGNWHGIAIYRCTDVTVASIEMYASPGAAFIPSDSDGTVIRDSIVTRKPGSNRWISANADGVHNHGGRIGPRIFGNTFESLHDDGINIYSTSRAATSVSGTTIALGAGAMQLAPGDAVQIVNMATGTLRGETTVVSVTGDSLSGGPVSASLAAMPTGTASGDQMFNRSFSAPGADVQYNAFRELRGLGVRLRTGGAYVHANEMFDLAYWGIWVANDPQYNEGPVGSVDSIIERNSIVRVCVDRSMLGWPSSAAGIMIENLRDDYEGGASKPHHGHVVKDNYIEDPPRFGIFVGGAENITVSGNTIASTAGNPRTGAPTAMFGTRNSHAVALSALTVHEYAASPRAVVWGGAGVTGFTHT